jgi:hypothetical protein
MTKETHCVAEYDKNGKRLWTVSGLGCHEGTMDSLHSQRTAQRQAATLREEFPHRHFKVEPAFG